MQTVGYSRRSLLEKLGLNPHMRALFLFEPPGYFQLLGDLPDEVMLGKELEGKFDFMQVFVTESARLEQLMPELVKTLDPNSMLWVSWPKGSSGMATDLNENIIRDIGLTNGVVDVKVIAIDE